MIHILIISLNTEKPFYLLRRQSFSFQIVSRILYPYVSRGGAFEFLGRVFVHNDCPRGSVFAPFVLCPWGGGGGGVCFRMKLIFALQWIR